jgi:hypothetical protein
MSQTAMELKAASSRLLLRVSRIQSAQRAEKARIETMRQRPVRRETASQHPAPRELAPREPAPREPAPREPAPREPAPREPAPREPVPREPVPREPALATVKALPSTTVGQLAAMSHHMSESHIAMWHRRR